MMTSIPSPANLEPEDEADQRRNADKLCHQLACVAVEKALDGAHAGSIGE